MTSRPTLRRLGAALLATGAMTSLAACGGSGASAGSDDAIVVGTSMARSGAGSETCTPIEKGAQAWIDQVNEDGGVGGRPIEVKIEDDAYQASEALANAREFAGDQDLVALFNGCGSPTAAAIAAFAEQRKVPYLFPWADADALENETYYSLVPGNGQMAASLLTETMKDRGAGSAYVITIALPGIESSFGAIEKAAEAGGGSYAGDTRITLNQADMSAAVLKAKSSGADYVLTITNAADSAKLVNTMAAQDAFPGKALITSSSTPTTNFLSGIDEGVDLSKVVATSVPVAGTDEAASSCVEAFEAQAPDLEADAQSLTGCTNAQALVAVLEAAGDDVSRESILKTLADFSTDDVPALGTVAFGDGPHLGVSTIHGIEFADDTMSVAYEAALETP